MEKLTKIDFIFCILYLLPFLLQSFDKMSFKLHAYTPPSHGGTPVSPGRDVVPPSITELKKLMDATAANENTTRQMYDDKSLEAACAADAFTMLSKEAAIAKVRADKFAKEADLAKNVALLAYEKKVSARVAYNRACEK